MDGWLILPLQTKLSNLKCWSATIIAKSFKGVCPSYIYLQPAGNSRNTITLSGAASVPEPPACRRARPARAPRRGGAARASPEPPLPIPTHEARSQPHARARPTWCCICCSSSARLLHSLPLTTHGRPRTSDTTTLTLVLGSYSGPIRTT